MSDRHDIEESLRRFRHNPDGRVKDAALASYRRTFAAGPAGRGFWRRRVPLYAAAAAVVVLVGLSFVAGNRLGAVRSAAAPAGGAVTSTDVEWSRAESDLL